MHQAKSASCYTCKICNNSYKEKFNYDRHVNYCEFLYKSKREKENDIEISSEKLPSYEELFGFVKELAFRVDKLEKENDKLKTVVRKEKHKIDVLQWLNEKSEIVPEMTFDKWILSLPIYDNLDVVFKNDLLAGIYHLFDIGINHSENIPISAFSNKPNTFYIYEEKRGEIKWNVISTDYLDKWLNYITKRFIIEFKNWCSNKQGIGTSEKMTEIYIDNYQKILGGKMSDEMRNGKVKKHLYEKIKQNLKNVNEFEIV